MPLKCALKPAANVLNSISIVVVLYFMLSFSSLSSASNYFSLTPMFSRQEILVEINIRDYPGDLDDLSATAMLILEDNGDSHIIAEEKVNSFRRGMADVYVPLEDCVPGEYRMNVVLYEGGIEVYSGGETFELPEVPVWLREQVGIEALSDDTVLPPFQPVEIKRGKTVQVWNRRYDVAGLGLPSQVYSAGAGMLAGPARLSLVSGNIDILEGESAPQLVKQADGAVEYYYEGQAGPVKINTSCRVEFDGLYLFNFEIEPAGSIEVEKLSLHVPLKAAHSPYLYAAGEPSERTTEGPLILDRGMSMGLSGEGVQWKSPFKESVWLGDDSRGLVWYTDSEANWHPQEYSGRPDAMRVVKDGEVVRLEIDFIKGPFELIGPVQYSFGFMATPVRPKPEGWRGWKITTSGGLFRLDMGFTEGYKGDLLVYWPRGNWDAYYQSPLISDKKNYREFAEAAGAEGCAVLPYLAPQLLGMGLHSSESSAWQETEKGQQTSYGFRGDFSPDEGEWKLKDPYIDYFGDEFKIFPERFLHQKREDYNSPVLYVCPRSSWNDYALWFMREHARLGADGIGILDGVSGPCSNTLHGCGYVNRRGELRPTYWGSGVREMSKRLLYMFEEERQGERPHITGLGIDHIHAFNPLKAVHGGSFFDAGQKGEELNSGYFMGDPEYRAKIRESDYYYSNMLPLEKFRIEFGHQWGWVPVFFPQLKKSPGISPEWAASREGTKDFLVLTLLHDVLVWPIWCNGREVFNTWLAKDRFGIGDEGVEFFPYWENGEYVNSSSENVFVSFYRKPGKIFLIAANLSVEPDNSEISVDIEKIGAVGGEFQAFEIVNGTEHVEVHMETGHVLLDFPPRDYRMIIIEEKS